MRVATWNHGYNTGYFDGAHRGWHHLLDDLSANALLLQETTIPDWAFDRGFPSFLKIWDSRLWGCVVYTPNEHEILISDPTLRVLAVRTSLGELGEVVLASFHAVSTQVIPPLRVAVEALLPHLVGNRFIVGGDLNTARGADQYWPDHGHLEFFRWLDEDLGWYDCHWRLQGREEMSVWSPGSRPLQTDHIFVDGLTAEAISGVRVVDDETVRSISDHGPLVVDIG